MDDDAKRLEKGKKIVIDKQTGKKKEVDIYDRSENTKKKDPEKLKAIFSSTLEQSIIPESISIYYFYYYFYSINYLILLINFY